MNTPIGQLMEFVESLEISDGIFKQSVLEGIEAMEHTEQEPTKSGIRRISNTKWAYTKTDKDIAFGYGDSKVPLDEETKKEIMENFEPPVYIKNLDSLFFCGNLIVSPYGIIGLPEGISLEHQSDIPEEIKGAIFVATDGKKRNFISIRDMGNGEFQWGYLFGDWAPVARTEPTDMGTKLVLVKRGKPIAELFLPELARNENIESKDEFFTDPRDNKKYRIVTIGNQTWLAENMNWESVGVWFENKKSNGKKYGRLYTWEEAMKVAPTGWHLPTDEEWTALMDYVGGAKNAATILKSDDWNGSDEFGFSALPGGFLDHDGDFGTTGSYGNWWSATEKDSENAYLQNMYNDDAKVHKNYNYKDQSLSVRLIKD